MIICILHCDGTKYRQKGNKDMYSFLHTLLADRKGGEIFTLFSISHFAYIALAAAAIIALLLLMRHKDAAAREKLTRSLSLAAFLMYVADLFLMPLAYGEIDIEKLPFHACTAMCVACFLSYHVPFLAKYRTSFAMLGLISNLVYLIYPAGVMWHAVHPLSYRVIQTLLFHALMTVYTLLLLIWNREQIRIKHCYRELLVTCGMTLWALLGNYAYNGQSEGYDHFFNWFFVVRDPFYAIPQGIAPILMPFLNVALFFALQMVLHLILWAMRRQKAAQ